MSLATCDWDEARNLCGYANLILLISFRVLRERQGA